MMAYIGTYESQRQTVNYTAIVRIGDTTQALAYHGRYWSPGDVTIGGEESAPYGWLPR